MIDFNNITIAQLGALIEAGARIAVTCKRGVLDLEAYAEPGMRAMLVQTTEDSAECRKIDFDFTQFDEFNKQFESANYYDATGKPTLTAREKGQYKLRETYYFCPSDPASLFFEPLNPEQLALMEEFSNTGAPTGKDYVTWLEQQVLAQRANAQ